MVVTAEEPERRLSKKKEKSKSSNMLAVSR
jgi:hypothetical protein